VERPLGDDAGEEEALDELPAAEEESEENGGKDEKKVECGGSFGAPAPSRLVRRRSYMNLLSHEVSLYAAWASLKDCDHSHR